jgi:hypothetical protein
MLHRTRSQYADVQALLPSSAKWRPRRDAIPPTRQLNLDEWQDLGPELLHACEHFIGCRTTETKIEAADAHIAQRPDIGGDQRRRAGKQAMLAITGL